MSDTSVIFNILAKDNASGVMGKIGGAAKGLMAAFAVGVGVDAIRDAIGAASDLAETQSKVNVLFGSGSAALDQWASHADSAMGQSKQQALDAAATFGVFAKSAGLSGTRAVDFSTKMTTLASDMASFSNTSPQQAIEAIGAALRGESEPIRAYGVLLDDASLKAKAMSLGLIQATTSTAKIDAAQNSAQKAQRAYNQAVSEHGKNSQQASDASVKLELAQEKLKKATEGTTASLTPQQRVLAAQALIMDQTKDAQGDFARTSGGLANQQRIMAAEFENVKTKVGSALLPVMTKLMGVLVTTLGFVQKNSGWLTPLAIGLGVLAGAVWLVTAAQTAWNVAQALNPTMLIIIAVIALVAVILYLWFHSSGFRKFFIDMWNEIWGFLKGVGHWFAHDFADFFVNAYKTVMHWADVAGQWVRGRWDALVANVTSIPGRIRAAASGMWDGIKDAFRGAVNWIIGRWNNLHFSIPSFNVFGYHTPGFTLNLPDIPMLAVGGTAARGGLAMVGEKGAEVVSLPTGASVYPHGTAPAGSGGTLRIIGNGDSELATFLHTLQRRGILQFEMAS